VKGLSVRQPWAELIASGRKTVEMRMWSTNHRGPLVICAGQRQDANASERFERGPLGVLICVVDLVDVRPMRKRDARAACCHHGHISDELGWILESPRRVRPVPIKGQLKLFLVPDRSIFPI